MLRKRGRRYLDARGMTDMSTAGDGESLHRLVKLALDNEEVMSVEEAYAKFHAYRLHIHVGEGLETSYSGQAALLTAINTAARAFLGGVVLTGDLAAELTIGRFTGESVAN